MPPPTVPFKAEGGCACRAVRFRLESAPPVVHCCACRGCQRASGSAFVVNAVIESDRVTALGVAPETVDTPSHRGAGQQIARCSRGKVAVWSHGAGAGPVTKVVRAGTLDDPDALPPEGHVFTQSKQPWVVLPIGARAFDASCERERAWGAQRVERLEVIRPKINAHRAAKRGGGGGCG